MTDIQLARKVKKFTTQIKKDYSDINPATFCYHLQMLLLRIKIKTVITGAATDADYPERITYYWLKLEDERIIDPLKGYLGIKPESYKELSNITENA